MAKASTQEKNQVFVGRRKESTARIVLREGSGKIVVNKKDFKEYFPRLIHQLRIMEPFKVCGVEGKFDVIANIKGGGITGQADALRLAISRALASYKQDFEPILKKGKFLTRDPRMVERKKYGKHKARRGHQFSKR